MYTALGRFWCGLFCIVACLLLGVAPVSAQRRPSARPTKKTGKLSKAKPTAASRVVLLLVARGGISQTKPGERAAKPASSISWLGTGDRLQLSSGAQVELVHTRDGSHCRVMGPGALFIAASEGGGASYIIKGARLIPLPAVNMASLRPLISPPSLGEMAGERARDLGGFHPISPVGFVRSLTDTATLRWENPKDVQDTANITLQIFQIGVPRAIFKAEFTPPVQSHAVPEGLLKQGPRYRWELDTPGAVHLEVDFAIFTDAEREDFEAAKQAARAFPTDDISRHFLLARCYEAYGMNADALAEYSLALKKAPSDPAVRQAHNEAFKRVTGNDWKEKLP